MITLTPQDVMIDVIKNVQPASNVSADRDHFFYSGGPFSTVGSALKPLPYIDNITAIKVGNQKDPKTPPNQWQFGYIQSCEVKQVFFAYSGAGYLQGSVGISLTPDGSFVAPDEFGELDALRDPNLKSADIRPWTRLANNPERSRFTFKSDKTGSLFVDRRGLSSILLRARRRRTGHDAIKVRRESSNLGSKAYL